MERNYDKTTMMTPVMYMGIVDSIAEKYFDADGNYTPQWGWLGTIAIFYNTFFADENKESDGLDFDELDGICNDAEFMRKFTDNISGEENYGLFSFYRAYHDAMQIVEYRKSAAGTVRDAAKYAVDKVSVLFNEFIGNDGDGLKRLLEMTENGSLTPEGIVDAFAGNLEKEKEERETKGKPVPKIVAFEKKE